MHLGPVLWPEMWVGLLELETSLNMNEIFFSPVKYQVSLAYAGFPGHKDENDFPLL